MFEKIVRNLVLVSLLILIWGTLVVGGLKVYAHNECMKWGLSTSVYAYPAGVYCVVSMSNYRFLAPLWELPSLIGEPQELNPGT